VTNQSANPVSLAGAGGVSRKLGKGDVGALMPGDCVEFIGNAADGSGAPVMYLRLELVSDMPEHRGYPSTSAPTKAVVDVHVPASSSSSRGPAGGGGGRGGGGGAAQAQMDAGPLLPAYEDARHREPSGPPFWLILGGSCVKDAFPAEQRRLEGHAEGLTVGRAHQQALHANAFDPALRQYLSRDHFRIECGGEGCRLVPLSSNPMWRQSGGRLEETEVGKPALRLRDGDEILLFTGADDCTPDGPGNLGLLRWVFREGSSGGGSRSPRGAGRGGGGGGGSTPRGEKDRNRFIPFGWEGGAQAVAGQLPVTPRQAGRSKSPRRAHFGDSTLVARGRPPQGSGYGGDSGTTDYPPGHWRSQDVSMPDLDDKFAASGFRY